MERIAPLLKNKINGKNGVRQSKAGCIMAKTNNPRSESKVSEQEGDQDVPDRPDVDHGTAELRNHHTILKTRQRSYILSQTPIDYYYYSKKTITRREYQAGTRLMEAFARSGILPATTAAHNPLGVVSSGKSSTSALEGNWKARQEVRRALEATGGQIAQYMVFNVVCFGFSLKELQIYGYSTPSTKMARFKEALQALADFYRAPLDD